MLNKERDYSIDLMKGFAILTVFMSHMQTTPRALDSWFYSFHMPLFFLCSGLVFSPDRYSSFKDFAIKKFKSIVIPYFCLGLSMWVLATLMREALGYIVGIRIAHWDLPGTLLSLLLGHRHHAYYFPLWFLCTLFFGELVFFFIAKYLKNNTPALLCVGFGGTVLQWLVLRYVYGFYWSIDLVPVCVAFLSMGFVMQKHAKRLESFYRLRFAFPALAISIVFAYLNCSRHGSINLCQSSMGNPVYYFIAGIAGSWLITIISKNIGDVRFIRYFGRNTLISYVFQNAFVIPLSYEIILFLGRRSEGLADVTLQWLMVLALSLFITSLIIQFINRYTPWMLGKPIQKRSKLPV